MEPPRRPRRRPPPCRVTSTRRWSGRERQLAQLRQSFDAADEDDACQLFTVLGSAGVGKSRSGRGVPVDLGGGRRGRSAAGACRTARASPTSRSSRRSNRPRAWPTSTCPTSSRRRSARSSRATSTRNSSAATCRSSWASPRRRVRRGDVLGDPEVLRGLARERDRSCSCSTTSIGASPRSWTSSSTSPTGRAAPRSCSCAWRAPICSTCGRRGVAAS